MAKSASVPPDTDRHGTPRYVAQRYRLDTPIGRGGAGVVWRGEDELLQRPVAIKEILVPMAGAQNERDAIRARVLREARALARLHSPAIVSVYDVVEEHQRHWIVMELVDADSLGDVIRNHGPLPFDQVAAIGLALTDALAAAHSAGVLHRDVKPGNVLLGRDGRVRLTDFGIAATEGDVTLTGTGALVGSPAYIAPERVRGSSGSPASDLWGLGATLYSAVEGQPPFEGPETYAVLTAVVEGRRRAFRLAGPLRNLLSDLMDRPAEERPDVTEIRRRLIPVARNANPVPASVMNARQPAKGGLPSPSAADVGLENLDDTPDPAAAATGAVSVPHTGPSARGNRTGPRGGAMPPVPIAPPVVPVAADAEVTDDPVLSPPDETAISLATGGQPWPPRPTPAGPIAAPRTGPRANHDALTQIRPAAGGIGPARGDDDDHTRISTAALGTADIGPLDDDDAAGLEQLNDRARPGPPRGGAAAPSGGWRRGGRRAVALVAGAVVVLASAAVALALSLSAGGSTGPSSDVTAQRTTSAPNITTRTSVASVKPSTTAPVVITPDVPRSTRRTRTATTEPPQPSASPSPSTEVTSSPPVPTATATAPASPTRTPTAPPVTPTKPAPTTVPAPTTGSAVTAANG